MHWLSGSHTYRHEAWWPANLPNRAPNRPLSPTDQKRYEDDQLASYAVPMDMAEIVSQGGGQKYSIKLQHIANEFNERRDGIDSLYNNLIQRGKPGLAAQARFQPPPAFMMRAKEAFNPASTTFYYDERVAHKGTVVRVTKDFTIYVGSGAQTPAQIFADTYIRCKNLDNSPKLIIDTEPSKEREQAIHRYAAGLACGYKEFEVIGIKKIPANDEEKAEITRLATGIYKEMYDWLERRANPALNPGFINSPNAGPGFGLPGGNPAGGGRAGFTTINAVSPTPLPGSSYTGNKPPPPVLPQYRKTYVGPQPLPEGPPTGRPGFRFFSRPPTQDR